MNSLPITGLRIDTHRHLGGCIPVDFIWETIKRQNLKHVAETLEDVKQRMTFSKGEAYDFHRFLDKFKILDEIRWTSEIIDLSIQAICRDIIADRIDYCWMDFSINKYMEHLQGWHKREVIQFLRESFDRHAPGRVGLMLSLKYESSRASQRQYAKLIDEDGVADNVIGIDLVGDESYFDADFYTPFFSDWNDAGKITRAHVAESQAAENAMLAITSMEVSEVAHGLKIFEHPEIMRVARDQNVGFAIALGSNEMTGVWARKDWHPIVPMDAFGLDVMIGTDDPIQCGTYYDKEFRRLNAMSPMSGIAKRAEETAERRTRAYGLVK